MDMGRVEVLLLSSLLPSSGQGWIGGPAVSATLETGLEKPHPVEDLRLSMASPSPAADDSSSTSGLDSLFIG